MLRTRYLVIVLFALLSLVWFTSSGGWKKFRASRPGIPARHDQPARSTVQKLRDKAIIAGAFARRKGYNESVCFLVDMSLPSGQNRFFVYDMGKDSVLSAGLVTHGRCNEWWLEDRRYGNTPGCGCTSLGRYRIGGAYQGRFGLAFKLYGLDTTNSRAFERFVVLHSHSCVPEAQVNGDICQSDGCPTVAPGFLKKLEPLISRSRKPILLWIYHG